MTSKVGATALRNRIGDLISRVLYRGERVIIERRDQPVAALIPLADLRRLEELEDERDAALFRAAKQSSQRLVPLDQLVDQYEKLHGDSLELNEESPHSGQ